MTRPYIAHQPYPGGTGVHARCGASVYFRENRERIPKLFETIDTVIENQTLRIQTGVLNEILTEAVALQQPPSDKGKRLKIFYMTQVAVRPPTFRDFCQ